MAAKSENVWEVCIVGTGIIGSATAYALASKGCQRVLAIEQFPLPHTRGSSHGQSRVIRYSYGQKIYSQMMEECFKEWKSVEESVKTKLFHQCGLLSIDSHPLDAAKEVESILKDLGIDSQMIVGEEFKERFPMLNFPDDSGAVLEEAGGVLMANKCGQSLRELFIRNGGTLVDNEHVDEIIPGEIITIKTSKQTISTKRLIITAGPWTSKLTNQLQLNLPLQPCHVNVCYWKTTDKRYRADEGFPTFADFCGDDAKKCGIYGLPCIEYPDMIKICLHHGTNADPDSREFTKSLANDLKAISEYIGKHFRNVELQPSIVETCMYTMTPDDDFILDYHPKYRNIVIGAGFSGHGFKLAPVVGKLLSELSLEKPLSYDVTPFRMSRFDKPKSML